MANFNILYELRFMDYLKREKKVQILQDGYEGDPITETFRGTGSPLFIRIQNQGDAKYETIKSTEIQLNIHSESRFKYLSIVDGTDKEFLMKVWEAPVVGGVHQLKHIGYIIPEIYTEAYTKAPYPVSVKATSLGILNTAKYKPGDEYGEYDYDVYEASGEFYKGRISLMKIIQRCLDRLGYGLEIWDSLNMFETSVSQTTSPLLTVKKDQADFLFEDNGRTRAKTCLEVLDEILHPFFCNFFMDYGRWVIIPVEYRANSRRLRKFTKNGDLISESNFNPLNSKVQWIGNDQQLEMQPAVDDIEVVYAHGRPEDAVRNHLFEDGFITIDKAAGEIRYPEEWELSAASDFNATAEYAGIRNTSIDSKDRTERYEFTETRSRTGEPITRVLFGRPSAAVFFHSFYCDSGAYIEQQGDRLIEADGDAVRFTLSYAGEVLLKSGTPDSNDTQQPNDTITHKMQIKIGSKYLQDNGAWSDTPVDIELTDLGDADSGYTVLTRIGVAGGLREFEVIADPIEEEGFARVRIYRPVSQNEGTVDGDTYCTVAYSEFSLELYPDGLAPTEDSTFFAERETDSFAQPIEFNIFSGDGPTNLHSRSYLIDTAYGDDLRTEEWNRLNLTGTLGEILVNMLFIEYANKSNLIRGTQRVSRLFDRWFVESFAEIGDIGYAPFSGTYDEKRCEFSGEYIQIQSAEVDIWGPGGPGDGDLEPGPNFAVSTSFDIDNSYFDGELIISAYQTSPNNDAVLLKMQFTFDYSNPSNVTEESKSIVWRKTAKEFGITPRILNSSNRNIYWLKNGNILWFLTGPASNPGYSIILLDSDGNLINSFDTSLTEWTGEVSSRTISTDLDNNIYLLEYYEEGSITTESMKIVKYDSALNKQWTSSKYWLLDDFRSEIVAGQNHVFIKSGNGELTSINQSDGSTNTNLVLSEHVFLALLPNDRIMTLRHGGGSALSDNVYTIYDSDLNVIEQKTGDQITNAVIMGSNFAYSWAEWISENTLMIFHSDLDAVVWLNYSTWEFEKFYGSNIDFEDLGGKMTQVNGQNFAFVHGTGTTSRSTWLNLETRERAGAFFATSPNSVDQGEWGAHGPFVNWQLYKFGDITPGSPNIVNVTLTASPQTADVPFESVINFGAENTGDANITLSLVIAGSVEDQLIIPAGGSASDVITKIFNTPGIYAVSFGGESLDITATGEAVSGDYEGRITIDSPATDDEEAVAPEDVVYVTNSPSVASDLCSGSGTNKVYVGWKETDYCFNLPKSDPSIINTVLVNHVNSNVPGLNAVSGISPSGYPTCTFISDTEGTADNGESVVLKVPTAIEQDGLIFNQYTMTLSGGIDGYIVNEQIDILIDGAVFATTSAVVALETADSIAQKIYDACAAIGSGTYSFAKNGTQITVGSTAGEATLDLDIKNAGFSYTAENIEEV